MGKMVGRYWFDAVKRAFRSPTKEDEKCSRRRQFQSQQEEDDEQENRKKKEKRRWVFRKSVVIHETIIQHNEAENINKNQINSNFPADNAGGKLVMDTLAASNSAPDEQKQALAVAMATRAAAEAAAATAKAAAEILRLTIRPSSLIREERAAIVIQAAFRGFLARRALAALRALVKLQALVRGHNVRRRTKLTLQCMEALIRVQARFCDQRKRLSCDGNIGTSLFRNSSKKTLKCHLADGKSYSRSGNSILHDWEVHPPADEMEESEATFQKAESIYDLQSQASLPYAYNHQIRRSSERRDHDLLDRSNDVEDEEKCRSYLRHRMARSSFDERGDEIKTVEIDTARYSASPSPSSYCRRSLPHDQKHQDELKRPCPYAVSSSPVNKTQHVLQQSPRRASSSSDYKVKTMSQQLYMQNSASPRSYVKKDRICSYQRPDTPSLLSNMHYKSLESNMSSNVVPSNYMAATESAKARFRSHSAPRQRGLTLTPEREKPALLAISAKKRLLFPVPDPFDLNGLAILNKDENPTSPSFKNICQEKYRGDQSSPSSSYKSRRRA